MWDIHMEFYNIITVAYIKYIKEVMEYNYMICCD